MQSLVTLNVDAYGPTGVWDKRTGGDADSSPPKHRAGGMGPEDIYPALVVFTNITLSRVLDYVKRQDNVLLPALMAIAGSSMCTVTEQPLDADGNSFGAPLIWRGMLSAVHSGTVDSTSETPRMWECEVVATQGP